jgi:two-component system, response regulator, stage 0 sporulation protein F
MNAIVGILVDSPLLENRLQPATETRLGDFPPAPKKSPKVGVLIVDDESLIRWSLAETLIDHDYTVMEAGDGKQALAVLKNPPAPVEVVMLDYRLPDTNGLQLLAAIRGLSPASRVVMMTAYGTADVMAEAIRLGAVCVVNKPIEMQDVAEIVLKARAPILGACARRPSSSSTTNS